MQSARRWRCARRSLFAPLGAALALATAVAVADESAPNTNVIEFLTYVRSARGLVRCGLFTRAGWLKRPLRAASVKPEGQSALCTFRAVRAGNYALSAFHDENANGKLDTNFLGLPSEDYCASRDARGTFGPPSFDAARFDYAGGVKRLAARMK